MQQQQRPHPQLLFTFAFYIGSAAFAVVAGASMFAGAGADAAVLRGVQALLAFLFVGWVAETIVQATPAPRAKAKASGAGQPANQPSVAKTPVAMAADNDAVEAAGEQPAADTGDALSAIADLPTAEELMADDPLALLRDDDATDDLDNGDETETETEDFDDRAELAA